MSAALSEADGAAAAPAAGDPDTEARARAIGWKDRHEFPNGPPANWADAETFLQRGSTDPGLMRAQIDRLSKQNGRLVRDIEGMKDSVATMTEMTRRAEERAYARAKRELEAEKDKAIETGDKAAVARVDRELGELKPVPAAAAAPAAPAAPGVDPAIARWVKNNTSWFNIDAELTSEADFELRKLETLHQDWSVEDRLQELDRRLRAVHPEKFQNARRAAPAAVAPAANGAQPAPSNPVGRRFQDLPAEAKAQFHRYKKMLKDKGKPLTEEEWVNNYDWS